VEAGVLAFRPEVTAERVAALEDEALAGVYRRAQRYNGKGCLYAVDHVHEFAAPLLEGKNVADWSLLDIDRALLDLELATARRRGKPLEGAAAEIGLKQRKQNLGMNAILSISLALARGVAHVRGQDLYEFLREQMLVMIERLAAQHEVAIEGSRFEDYVAALRAVNLKLEQRDISLHESLREVSGIYAAAEPAAAAPARRPPAITVVDGENLTLDDSEREQIAALNRALVRAYGPDGSIEEHSPALREYLRTIGLLNRRYGMFGIVNHRIFRSGDSLIVPYDARGRLSIH
jgi:hypothetical protein